MNAKQRTAAAIARQPVDRIPLGLYAVDHDTVSAVLGRPAVMRNQVAMQVMLWEGRRDELIQQWKQDLSDFYRRIDCADVITCRDAMLMPPPGVVQSPLLGNYPGDPREAPRRTAENEWTDSAGRVYKAVPEVNEIRCVHDPVARQRGEPTFRVEDFAIPDTVAPPDESVFAILDHAVATFGRDRYVLGPSGGCVGVSLPGGFETGLVLYAEQPEIIHAANRQAVAVQKMRDASFIRPGIDGALFDQDTAGTNAPFISPAMFREMSLPYMKQRVAEIKQRVPQMVLHNCGHNLPLVEMFIEAGADCYQSLQTTAGMEIGMLQDRFGGRIAFWGGVPVETLIAGSADDTRAAVRTALERGARPGCGLILGPSQSIAKGTKYENFMAMLDEFVRLRDRYGTA